MARGRAGAVGVSARGGGRPADASRAEALRSAALDLLVEQGYEAVTIDSIAARARASKATAYWWWRSKADLILDAVTGLHRVIDVPDTGSLAGDLDRLCVDLLGGPNSRTLTVVQRLVSAMPHNAGLAAAISEHLIGPRRAALVEVLGRAQVRGEVPADKDLDLVVSVLPALVIYQICTGGGPPTPDLLRRIMTEVLLPAATASSPVLTVGAVAVAAILGEREIST